MTTEEQFKKIIEHCEKHDEYTCGDCVLSDTEYADGGICIDKSLTNGQIHQMYNLIFEPLECDDRKYWSNICKMQKAQTEKGKKTYGQTLEENISMNMKDRLEYLEEELIDALMYIEHIKALMGV